MNGVALPRTPSVKGWCPGALSPMATGDGLLVRLKLRAGRLSASEARQIAALSQSHGNGHLDLTQRANLQLRGVTAQTYPSLIQRLSVLGLVDSDPRIEATRNIVTSPLSDHDPAAPIDGMMLAADLEAVLGRDPLLSALPAKFGFLIDDGASLPLDDIDADIRLVGNADQSGSRVSILLGADAASAIVVGYTKIESAANAAAALARQFIRLKHPEERRMRDLVTRIGAPAIARAAGLEAIAEVPALPSVRQAQRPPIGLFSTDAAVHALVGAPFGRLEAKDLATLGDAASRHGAGEIRITPWRAVLIPALRDPEAALATLAAAGLIVDPADPRRAVVACTGAPGCASATVSTLDVAAELVATFSKRINSDGDIVQLHVSGCAKGCARSARSPFTLVGRDGLFDMIRDGRTGDEPFATGLAITEARAILAKEVRA
jgi:precorrin-3B synthase